MISPAELKYFIEVTNVLNLSRAAERLGISQPSLSAAIKRLEDTIGTDLLIRHKKGVTLTQAGKQLLVHSKQLLQYWQSVKAKAIASHYEVEGNFILGCHPTIGLRYLSGFLPNLFATYPKIEIQLVHDISRKLTEGVISLAIDIGIIVNPIKHPDLIIQKLMDDEVTFYESAKPNKEHRSLFSGEAVIICDTNLIQTQWLLKNAYKKGITYKRILTSSSLEVIGHLTEHGCGIGILPGSVGTFFGKKRIKPIPKSPTYHDEICLVYRHENRNIKAVQVILNAIKGHF